MKSIRNTEKQNQKRHLYISLKVALKLFNLRSNILIKLSNSTTKALFVCSTQDYGMEAITVD